MLHYNADEAQTKSWLLSTVGVL